MAQLEGNNIDNISLHTYCKKQSFTGKSSQTKTMGWISGREEGLLSLQVQVVTRSLQRYTETQWHAIRHEKYLTEIRTELLFPPSALHAPVLATRTPIFSKEQGWATVLWLPNSTCTDRLREVEKLISNSLVIAASVWQPQQELKTLRYLQNETQSVLSDRSIP